MNQVTKAFREDLAKRFIASLQEQQVSWKKTWFGIGKGGHPVNAVTGRRYSGLNSFSLALEADMRGSEDPRWATFHQIKEAGWKLNKGAKGMKVEYWQPYDYNNKLPLSWEEYYNLHGVDGIGVISKYFYVFNGKDITGIPEIPHLENKDVVSDELISKIAEGMKISIFNDGGDRAFYRKSTDTIHLPLEESFESSYDYNVTALHELAHATGASSRLARAMEGSFGTASYAYEELVAEISSSFMSEHLEIQLTDEHFENHKAYIQSWIKLLEKDPNVLVKAIRDASAAANYLEYQGGLISLDEYEKSKLSTMEVKLEVHTKSSEEWTIEKHIQNCGYSATKEITSMYQELTTELGKKLSLQDICAAYKEHTYATNPRVDSLINSLAVQFQQQELVKLQMVAFTPDI